LPVARMGEEWGIAYRIFVGMPQRKRPLRRKRRRLRIVRMNITEMGWIGTKRISFSEDEARITVSFVASEQRLSSVELYLGVASCCASIQLVLYDTVNRNKVSIH
jgi:hypothetical protein